VFLLHCLLAESPPDTPQEIAALARNQERVAARGREPGLRLERGGNDALLTEWGGQVLEECAPIATALDAAHGNAKYCDTLMGALAALRDADAVPSARVLGRMAKDFDSSYVRFILSQSKQTKDTLLRLPLRSDIEARFRGLAQESIEEQQTVEAADTMSFENYRTKYQTMEGLAFQRNLTSGE
ncbi:MAG: glutamate--cysteine ligase, partial [Pseudomonadota bacterium]|nr:glutamate--cysteine ligase [Pseudomonadota bacterium]